VVKKPGPAAFVAGRRAME
jgi:outer membrane protein OmpA-like peptidoglycan-associated protein